MSKLNLNEWVEMSYKTMARSNYGIAITKSPNVLKSVVYDKRTKEIMSKEYHLVMYVGNGIFKVENDDNTWNIITTKNLKREIISEPCVQITTIFNIHNPKVCLCKLTNDKYKFITLKRNIAKCNEEFDEILLSPHKVNGSLMRKNGVRYMVNVDNGIKIELFKGNGE